MQGTDCGAGGTMSDGRAGKRAGARRTDAPRDYRTGGVRVCEQWLPLEGKLSLKATDEVSTKRIRPCFHRKQTESE